MEPVVSLLVVHDGGECAVDRAHIRLRVGLAVLLPEGEDFVLSDDDGVHGYIPHVLGTELRDDLVVDDVLAVCPGILSDGRPHVLGVDVYEIDESHAATCSYNPTRTPRHWPSNLLIMNLAPFSVASQGSLRVPLML